MSKFVSPTRFIIALSTLVALAVIPTRTAPLPPAPLPDFGALLDYPNLAGADPRAVATGDLNGDGYADLVIGQLVGVTVGLGDGQGGMTAGVAFGSGVQPNAVVLADINGDGHLDAVTSNRGYSDTTFSVLFGTGAGGFSAETTHQIQLANGNNLIQKLTAGDVTGDGAADVVVVSGRGCGANSRGCSSVTVFQNDGFGQLTPAFTRASNSPVGHNYSSYTDVATGDFNQDGYADLAVLLDTYDYGTEPQLEILPGTGSGNFGVTQYFWFPQVAGHAPYHSIKLQVGDVTGDGFPDVVAMSQRFAASSASALTVMRNDGTGAFPLAGGSGHPVSWLYGTNVMIGDLNDDGHLDIGGLGWGYSYYLNDGLGNFPTQVVRADVAGFNGAVLADLNSSGPGTLDPVFVGWNRVSSLLQGTPVAATCTAGTYSATGNEPCTEAPMGSYVDTEGATSATLCPVGTYSSLPGSVDCAPASPGSYVPAVGSTGSLLCLAGTYTDTFGSEACMLAAPGFYVPTSGATSQTACDAGYGSEAGATECYPLDNDGDGVNNDVDAYPNSDVSPTVSVGVCSTTVGNQVLPNGATFNDLLATAAAGAANHGALVSAVTQLANGWKSAGLISGQEHGAITSCVAGSKSAKSAKSQKSTKSSKSAKSAKSAKAGKSDKAAKSTKSGKSGKATKRGKK